MSLSELGQQLGDDLLVLLSTLDTPLTEVAPLSGVGYPGYQPSAFRLRFADGRILKARSFGSVKRAATVEHVSRYLDHQGFPKVLARSGSALLMEWIEGQPLNLTECGPGLLRECGALQGFMHSVPVPPDSPYRPSDTIEDWHSRLQQGLAELAEARVFEEDEVRRAFDAAMRYAPSSYAAGFAHRDFCAENLVLRPSGHVCAVDNEALAVDSYDYDLGRTWYRWPMSPIEREAYLKGYEDYRSSRDFLVYFPYWGIAALAGAAVFRLQKQADAASVPIMRLRALLRDLEQGRSASQAVFYS
jgi:hypothetical protein